MRFNKPVDLNDNHDLSLVGKLVIDGIAGSSLVAVDTLRIDSLCRITLTKKVRDVLAVKQGDTIALYPDGTNSDLIVKLLRGSKIMETLRIKREKTESEGSTPSTGGQRSSLIRKSKYDTNQIESPNSLDKVIELSAPLYHQDDPNKRYFPNIVLIDDDPDVSVTFRTYLSKEGINVQTFSKPNEALKYLTSHPSDVRVVITDIRMPGVNGLELYQALRAVNKNLKVIFVTALDAANELLSIFPDVKENDIILKPIEADGFVKRVKGAIFGCLSSFTLLSLDTFEIFSQSVIFMSYIV